MFGHKHIGKGSVVQFRMHWEDEPCMDNVAVVTRIAKNRTWADVRSVFGAKRVPFPDDHLKLVKQPIVVHI